MAFDLDSLTNQSIDTANATSVKPCPIGEYTMRVAELRPGTSVQDWFRTVKTQRGDSLSLKVPFEILDDGVKAALHRDTVIASMDLWIDVDAAGAIATGEGVNVGLGRLREALGLNGPGFSFAKLPGSGPCRGMVDHDPDKNDPETRYARVTRVVKL